MIRRPLGRTGITVPALTLGSSAWARDPGAAQAMLEHALDAGIDTIELDAGNAAAVALIGEVLRHTGAARHVQLLVRFPALVPLDLPSPHIPVDAAYPGATLRATIEGLLATLGVERIALVQLHAWAPEWLGEGDWLESLQTLGRAGKIGGIGVSLFDHDLDAGIATVPSGAIHAVQAMYNLFDQGAAAALFPLCRQNGVAALARSPFYFGALARAEADWPAEDWRHAYFYPDHARETAARRAEIARDEGDVAALALRFALSYPDVTSVVTGIRTPAQLAAALDALEQGPLSPEQLAGLARHRWLC